MTRLVLIHGWGFDASFWRPLRVPGVETVTVDLGFRGKPSTPNFRPDDVAVGHSLGFLWALRHGPWRAAVSINGFPRFVAGCDFPFGVARRVVDRMAARCAEAPAEVAGDFMARCGAPAPTGLDGPRLVEGLSWLARWDERPALAAQPVLALAARQDPIVPPALTGAAFGAPVWHSGGHLLPVERPGWVAERILDFLESLR